MTNFIFFYIKFQVGFVNSLTFANSGRFVVAGVGQVIATNFFRNV